MATKSPEIEILIRTQADTTGLDKASASIGKLENAGDTLESQTARTRAAFDAFDAKIKETANSTEQAAESVGSALPGGMTKALPVIGALTAAAGAAIAVFKAWVSQNEDVSKSFSNLQDAANEAMAGIGDAVIGDGKEVADFLDNLTRLLGGQTEEMKKWGHTSEEMAALHAESQKAASEVVKKELEEQNALYDEAMAKLKEMGAEDQAGLDDASRGVKNQAAEEKAQVDADDTLTQEEKAAKKAEIEDRARKQQIEIDDAKGAARAKQADEEARLREQQAAAAKKEAEDQEVRVNKLEKIDALEKSAATAREQAKISAAEAERQTVSGPVDPRYGPAVRAQQDQLAAKAREDQAAQEKMARERSEEAARLRKELPGVGPLESEKAEGESKKTAATKAAAAAAEARRKADAIGKDEDRKRTGRAEDESSRDRINEIKGRGNADGKGKAEGEDIGDLKKDLAEAKDEAKNATKATEEGGDNLSEGLKLMADMVKSKNKAMAAALDKMAADLEDGASPEEMARIHAAMKVAAESQNKAFSDLGKAMDTQAKAIETAAKMGADALKKSEALEAKIKSMRANS